MDLPIFKYHPDPLATGSIIESNAMCHCCEQSKGYIYISNVYAEEDLDNKICPWCIADGSAAQKFDATFSESIALEQAGISKEIIVEVTTRTPGYVTWQPEFWLSHCNDACVFLGDASKDDVLRIANENTKVIRWEDISEEVMKEIAINYQPKESPAFYKFQCLHCNKILYTMDYL